MTQLLDDNEFICHGDGIDFFMRFEQRGTEASESIKVDERYETKPCFQGQLNIIACYNSIELRDDGLYDVSTDDGYGLCDKDMQVIVPAKYDYPIEGWGYQLMIVVKKGKYGVINQKAEEIIPCVYTSIKIGTDKIEVWNYSSEYNDYTGDWESKKYIGNQCNLPTNIDVNDGEVFIVGINTDVKEGSGIFGSLLNMRQIPNHFFNRNLIGSLCDIYLPNGKMLTHFTKIPTGGIEYSKEFGTIMIYDRSAYSKDYGEFYEGVKLFFIETHKTSHQYAQIKMLNKKIFLAFDYSHVGILSNDGEDESVCRKLVPFDYYKISIPINNIIYAWKWCDDKNVIDVFDVSEGCKLIISIEHPLEYSVLKKVFNEKLTEEQRSRLVELDNKKNIIEYFPYEEFYEGDSSGSPWGQ